MIVSFDFDQTLSTGQYEANAGVLDHLWNHIDQGDKVIILTRRYSDEALEVFAFIEMHDLPLGRQQVFFTNGEYKGPAAAQLGVDLHYDDKPEEIQNIQEYSPQTQTILVF